MKQSNLESNTKKKILDAANKVVFERGGEGFTLDLVARAAGVSKGGLLYHFPSKEQLIKGMIECMIAKADAVLKEELVKCEGNYLSAYIRASFRITEEPEGASYALLAAIANNPDLIEPLQSRFFRMQEEITSLTEAPPEVCTLIRLALDGLWISGLFGFAPPSVEMRTKMMDLLLSVAQKIKGVTGVKSVN